MRLIYSEIDQWPSRVTLYITDQDTGQEVSRVLYYNEYGALIASKLTVKQELAKELTEKLSKIQ